MNDNKIVDTSFTAIINAPRDHIDIPSWCFSLPEHEYQNCSPAHVTASLTTSPDGKRMSINVEIIGGSLMVQHYTESLSRKDHLILDSLSDVFTPYGRTTLHVTWEMSIRKLDTGRCEFTNHVQSFATEEFLTLLARQGIPFDQFRTQRQPASIAHNRGETPLFRRQHRTSSAPKRDDQSRAELPASAGAHRLRRLEKYHDKRDL